MWARLASLLLLFFGLTHQGSAQRVPPPALRIQCQVSSAEWSDRQPGAAWLVSLRTADGKVLEEVVVPAQSNPQLLDLGSRRSGTYIVAAYWFTPSTSFANPAVTIARALTDSFAGIRPADVPGFVGGQLVGGLAAVALFRWLHAGSDGTA